MRLWKYTRNEAGVNLLCRLAAYVRKDPSLP